MKQLAETTRTVDLDSCDREPIHIPDAIQPHGRLLAYDVPSLRLKRWSANIDDALGKSPVGGEPLDEVFGAATLSRLREIAAAPAGIVHPLRAQMSAGPAPGMVLAAAHVWKNALIIELDRDGEFAESAAEDILSLPLRVNLANQRMHSAADEPAVFAVIAEEVRAISGYDRVMVYRFLEAGHGAVVGEARKPELESFLGLHYPATDIPEPARRLYKLNTVRSIADIHALPAPLLPGSPESPLDLSFSVFRAVSPIHIEYLQNMGVAASMSISILQDGELWGLIACHHYSPRFLTLEQRAVCETLGTMAGAYVTLRSKESAEKRRAQRRKVVAEALQQLASRPSFPGGVEDVGSALQGILEADGMAWAWNSGIGAVGVVPQDDVVRRACGLAADAPAGIWATESLAEELPEFADVIGEACGCLAINLTATELAGVVFFRREYAHEVRWAGEPGKIAEETDAGMRLSPRRSFAEWKQAVHDRSRTWSSVDHAMAEEIRAGFMEILSRRAAELSRMNEELSRLNSDLDSFAYAASHDLREPLRGLNQAVYLLEQELPETQRLAARERLDALRRLTGRMDELVGGLLRLSRAGAGNLELSQVPLEEVASEAAELVFGRPVRSDVDLTVAPGYVLEADYLCLRELLTNLLENGYKYNRHEVKRLHIGVDETRARTRDGRPVPAVFVRDNGIGIAPEKSAVVFDIFRRLHLPEEFGGGSGAGLTIAKKIAERHGGRIWVESTPGAGTAVYFTLRQSVISRPSAGDSQG